MVINLKQMLEVAGKHHFAVGAFNTTDSNLFRACVEAAEASQAPCIIQADPNEFNYSTADFYTYVRQRLEKSPVPFVLHLDHGTTLEQCVKAIQAGFTSVMLDGSKLSFEENAELTRKVTELAHMADVSVEGELGTIGLAMHSDEGGGEKVIYTEPRDVVEFVKRTGVDALAVSIGTAHGIYPKGRKPEIRLDLLKQLEAVSAVPLVIHGGSDNPDEEIAEACRIGVRKVNVSSDIKMAFAKKAQEIFNAGQFFTPIKVYPACLEVVRDVISHKMAVFGSVDKAYCYRQGAAGA